MPSTPDLPFLRGVRQAVRQSAAYPFTPVTADIKLDQNESPNDFPAELRAEALRRMERREWNRYPDLHTDRLRQKIADYEHWDAQGVVVTPGSNVMIKLLTELAGLGQTVVTTKPVFSLYTLEAQLLGATLVEVPLNPDFSLPVAGLVQQLAAHTPGLLVLTEPHAPTGYLDSVSDVSVVLEAAGQNWVVVVDEAYHQYTGQDLRHLIGGHANRLSLRTFSKAWGLAGLRLGYALTSPELGSHLQKLLTPFNVNVLTECVVEVALEHPEYMRAGVAQTIRERDRVLYALANHPKLEVFSSHTNFFLLRSADPEATFDHLLSRGILVRRQDQVIAGCLRIGIGTPDQNDRLLAALQEIDTDSV